MDKRIFFRFCSGEFADGIPFPPSGATPEPELPLESNLVQSSRVPPLVDEATFMKDVIKRTPLVRGFLWRGFFSPKVPVLSPTTLIVKEDEVVKTPSHLGRCVSPSADKGEDLRVNCLVESQKWLVGFSRSGKDGVALFLLGVYLLDEVDEASLLAIVDSSVSEEEFHQESVVARQKNKGQRETLNLKSFVNYGNDYATSRSWKGKVHMI
jgi:hypothetical protein